jgi:hypothetical protein
MFDLIEALRNAKPCMNCGTCAGKGWLTVHRPLEWSPEVVVCASCDATGRAIEGRALAPSLRYLSACVNAHPRVRFAAALDPSMASAGARRRNFALEIAS